MAYRAKITTRGFYDYNPNLFDFLELPEGIDRTTCIESILLETDDLEVLYSNPNFFMYAIGTWSRSYVTGWAKLLATETLEYNPIENYDRIEEWNDSMQGESSGTNNSTVTNDRASFSSDLDPAEQTSDSSNSTGSANNNSQHSGRTHGNVGVTTTQQMLEQERKIATYSTIAVIAEQFKEQFCLMIY